MQQEEPVITRTEYLQLELRSGNKHQFYQGEVFAMTGGTFNHSSLGGNILTCLKNRLRDTSCEPMNGDMRVQTGSGLDTYPDISIYCAAPELTDNDSTLLNPVVIFEVLSPSTRSYDRGDKFAHYRTIPALMDYVLVDAENLSVEHFRKIDNEEWLLHVYTNITDIINLNSINKTLGLDEIYENIELP